MQITDLTQDYLNTAGQQRNKGIYNSSYSKLFDHYFTFFSHERSQFVSMTSENVENQKQLITDGINKAAILFKKAGLDTTDIECVLFVGTGGTNGHAFLDSDKVIAFFPIESYKTKVYSELFTIHEIAHALHYKLNPCFFYKTPVEKEDLSRNLICEGLATYISKVLLGTSDEIALWADHLDLGQAASWIKICEQKCDKFNSHILNHLHSSEGIEMFYLENLDDPFRSRGGYWMGMKLIEKIVKADNLNLLDLLSIGRGDFTDRIIKELETGTLCQSI